VNILLTNDDGVDSNITLSLLKALEEDGHNVTLIAPSKDKSGQGAAITLRSDVKIEKLSNNIYSVDGTPADCVFMGLMAILEQIPDIVISGINRGANMGDDVIHSGTLGAAFTARKLHFPPLAISIAGKSFEEFESAILATKMMLDWLGSKNNDSDCISVGKKLEDVVLDLIKSGITTKDIGGEKSTQEFTKEITNRL